MTTGQQLANSIAPFIGTKIKGGIDDIINNIGKTLDRNFKNREDLIQLLFDFIADKPVRIGGLTYRRNVNDHSFIQRIKEIYEIY